jgi:hypothetical protein
MLMQRKISQFLASAAPVALKASMGVAAGLLATAPALADTTVSTGQTAKLATSTAGNITVATAGTLTAPAGTTNGQSAITVDSSSTVTINGGGIVYAGTAATPQNGSIGVQINPGTTTTITNTGTIYNLENFTPLTINSGYVYSPVSGVSGRYGIYGAAGGVINATITNSAATTVGTSSYTGSIAIDGNNSAGIQIDSTLNGALNTQGNINVLGNNSYGVKLNAVTANGGASGNVTIGGVVTVTGAGSQGYVQSGDVAGVVLIDGAISNGYSYTDTQGTPLILSRNSLSNGTLTGTAYLSPSNTPVVEIDGNVGGGILINAPTTSTSKDTNRGSLTAYGNNAALQIGGATNIEIKGNANTDNGSLNANTNSGSFALGIDGQVSANSYYSSAAAFAVVIGGRGGTVKLDGGLEVFGTVSATSVDTAATALLINAGANVGTIFNSGTIKAAVSQPSTGAVFAIQDLSGSVTSLTNQGYISATGATDGASAAIDLSHTSQSVTLTQSYSVANTTNQTNDKAVSTYNPLTATLYAGITGDIYLGSGPANVINIQSGGVTGNTYLGAGSGNTVTAADVTRWVGNINVGNSVAGGSLTMALKNYAQFNGTLNLFNSTGSLTLSDNAVFRGAVTGGGNFDVTVNGGTFGAAGLGTTTIRNLNVASGGALNVFIDGTSGNASHLIANSATFASGAKLTLTINSLTNIASATPYDVLTATTLTGANTLTSSSINLPVLFNGAITTDANNVYVSITRATPAQLGLTGAQTAAYTAILNDAAANANIQNTLLSVYDAPTLRRRFNELLPSYDGGSFDVITRTTRLADKHFDDDTTLFSISNSAAWIEPIIFRGERKIGDTPGFKTTGGGISMGVEKVTPVGNIGLQFAYVSGTATAQTFANSVNVNDQRVKVGEVELGLFWRKSAGPLYIWAGGNVGRETFNATRTFFGQYTTTTQTAVNTTNFTYNAAGHWSGWSAAFNGGLSYTLPLGEHFSLRPRGVIEYDRLKERGYIETGDTPIALTIAGRTQTQTTATTTLAAKWSSGPSTHEGRPFAVEVEAGRRSWLSGNLGNTAGTFSTGDAFSLTGSHLPSAWVGNLSIMQGGLDYTWKIGTDVERGTDKGIAYGIRASLSIAL